MQIRGHNIMWVIGDIFAEVITRIVVNSICVP
jgi:hypothetical protein